MTMKLILKILILTDYRPQALFKTLLTGFTKIRGNYINVVFFNPVHMLRFP